MFSSFACKIVRLTVLQGAEAPTQLKLHIRNPKVIPAPAILIQILISVLHLLMVAGSANCGLAGLGWPGQRARDALWAVAARIHRRYIPVHVGSQTPKWRQRA